MSIIEFIKSLFAKRNEHVKSVEKIDKEIAEVLYKVEPQAAVVVEKPKKAKPKKKKPAKKKTNEPK